jgi:hypothetical protein
MQTQKPAHGPEHEKIETLEATVFDLQTASVANHHLLVALLTQREFDAPGALGRLKETFGKLSISDDFDVAVKQEIDRTILHAQNLAAANRGK